MPKFPTYDSKQNITQTKTSVSSLDTGLSAPLRTGSAEEVEAMGAPIKAAAQIIEKWNTAQDTMDYTSFKADTETKIAQRKVLTANDPDSSDENMQKHLSGLREDLKGSLSVFRNKGLAQKAKIELDHDISIASMQIGAEFRKKQLIQNESALYTLVETASSNIVSAPTQIMADQIKQEAEAAIQANLQNGTITPEKANKLRNDLRTGPIEMLVYNNPDLAKKQLEAGGYDLTPKERSEYITKSNALIKQRTDDLKEQLKVTQEVNYKQSMLQAFQGKLSESSINKLYEQSLISDSQRYKLSQYLFYHETPADDNLEVYNEIVEMQTNQDKTPAEINDYIIEQATKSNLKPQSATRLIQKSYFDYTQRRDDLIALNLKEMRTVAEEFFRNDIDEPDKSMVDSTLYTFNRRVEEENASGERITEIAQEIITDAIRKEYPEINQVETINRVKEMFGVKEDKELPPPKNTQQEKSPFAEYPDAFLENGVWKVIVDGKKYRVEE